MIDALMFMHSIRGGLNEKLNEGLFCDIECKVQSAVIVNTVTSVNVFSARAG